MLARASAPKVPHLAPKMAGPVEVRAKKQRGKLCGGRWWPTGFAAA